MFQKAGMLSEVPEGRVHYVEIEGEQIALCNAGGTIYAISSICTHDGGPLDQGEIEGETIVCPRHGARFDIRTGRVLRPPATRKLRTYPVEIRDGAIYVDPHP